MSHKARQQQHVGDELVNRLDQHVKASIPRGTMADGGAPSLRDKSSAVAASSCPAYHPAMRSSGCPLRLQSGAQMLIRLASCYTL